MHWRALIQVLCIVILSAALDARAAIRYDVNNDRAVSSQDALALVEHLLGLREAGGAIDCNGDGSADVADVVALLNYLRAHPPGPAASAPTLPTSVTTNLTSDTQFLYTGDDPFQTDVEPGVLESRRLALLRGRILNREDEPLPDVRVTILGHPEFGQTLTRFDGNFDMAVNGGGMLTLDCQHPSYLTVQRQVHAPWLDYFVIDDIRMTALDPRVTTIDLTAGAPMQVAEGSPASDADGMRTARLLVPGGAHATMRLPNQQVVALTQLKVRATEFTVGPDGPEAMPAPLPPTSAYTYCIEYSVDEAITSGALTVEFDRPLIHYNENFLDFPVGTIVPTGYYDREKGLWIPSDNGLVIKILGVNLGLAEVDTLGNDTPTTSGALDALGISDDERERLAALYAPGTTLWRVPITHFTPWDHNWPYVPPDGAHPPDADRPRKDREDKNCKNKGSIIDIQNQVLRESIPIAGTDLTLNYSSDRSPAANRSMLIPLMKTADYTVRSVALDIGIAGQAHHFEFPPAPNLNYLFIWDGKDAYGRFLQGEQPVSAKITNNYLGKYATSSGLFTKAFSSFGDTPLTANRTRQEIGLSQSFDGPALGGFDARGVGFGGWTLNAHHVYLPWENTLYMGDGTNQTSYGAGRTVEKVAHTGATTYFRCAPDGSIYYVSSTISGSDLRQWLPDGSDRLLWRYAYWLDHISLGPDGSVYVIVWNQYSNGTEIWRRDPITGSVQRFAGNWTTYGFSGDGGPAIQAGLRYCLGVCAQQDGSVLISDTGNNRIRRVTPDGLINTIAGDGTYTNSAADGDGGPASLAKLQAPADITIGPDGGIYFLESYSPSRVGNGGKKIRRIGPDGIITTIAGSDDPGYAGDGGPALGARMWAHSLCLDREGNIFIADLRFLRLRMINREGIIHTIAGGNIPYTPDRGDGGPAIKAFVVPNDLCVHPDGSLYFFCHGSYAAGRVDDDIRKISSLSAKFSLNEYLVPLGNADELGCFNAQGRHLRTIDAITGAVLYQFEYGQNGLLTGILGRNGLRTTIERDAAGALRAIVAPHAQRTSFIVEDGYLRGMMNPAGQTHSFTYHAGGLLETVEDPLHALSRYDFNEEGKLTRAENPAGGSTRLSKSRAADSFSVATRTQSERPTTYTVQYLESGDKDWIVTYPCGARSKSAFAQDYSTSLSLPDGTMIYKQDGPDPRFDMSAPVTKKLTISTPGGKTYDVSLSKTATLTNPNNLLSLHSLKETMRLNGHDYSTVIGIAEKQTTETTPMGRTVAKTLDAQGMVVMENYPEVAAIQFSYDAESRLKTVIQSDQGHERVLAFDYNEEGYIAQITDPTSHALTFLSDPVGRITAEIQPDGARIEARYDGNGNIISLTPPGRPEHLFEYTSANLMKRHVAPRAGAAGTTTLYDYNLDGAMTRMECPGGASVDFGYDIYGLLRSLDSSKAGIQVRYAPAASGAGVLGGNPSEIRRFDKTRNTTETLLIEYDGSFMTSTTWQGTVNGQVDHEFNNAFNVATERVNGAMEAAYEYDLDDLLIRAGQLKIHRNPHNGLITSTTLEKVSTVETYTGFGEVASRTTLFDGSPILRLDYEYDLMGRISRKTEQRGGITKNFAYTYDARGRLLNVTLNEQPLESISYDANGNRVSHTGQTGSQSGLSDEQDRLLQYGQANFQYTSSGELLSKTVGQDVANYDYDAFGNLLAVQLAGGAKIEYVIDGAHRRIGKKVNGILVQGFLYRNRLSPVAELDGAGSVVSRFVYGAQENAPEYMVKGGETYRIICDHLGSPRLVVNALTGDVAQQMEYDAYGGVTLDTNPGFQPFGFAGGIYDPVTKLVRFGSRDYDPWTGRWTCKDPRGLAGGPNVYAYVDNDPVNRIDPDGELWYDKLSDMLAGFGDTISTIPFTDFSITRYIRRKWDVDDVVNSCSPQYKGGKVLAYGYKAVQWWNRYQAFKAPLYPSAPIPRFPIRPDTFRAGNNF